MKQICALSIMLSVVWQLHAQAQAGAWYHPGAVGYGAYRGWGGLGWGGFGGWGGYGYGGIGATPGASYGHAMADIVRSQGMYNQQTSAAMINVEEARGKYIDNEKKWTEVYMMQRRIREADKAERVAAARDRNQRFEAYLATRPSNLPPRMSSGQLEPSTGKISWPSALMGDAFVTQRDSLDSLFASRAHTGTTADLSDAITKEVRALHEELRNRIREIPTQDYMAARKFLDSLAVEGRSPVI